ncbi:Protein tyrosine phosphatase-like protein, PTPLA [Musa troglodytarum]|uniref:Very-long-chain (3R)-3-hydroxyacyl-CoA dehydratase n=1 Tax=Musa troglodytarum TaxID=320322 RepID=A0A9E7IMC6_9LILI|nr:Protein tyrosine phosphatase-like protein, PTPLA [Musa troglodytarum]
MAGFLSTLRRIYLSLYNWTVFVGWFQVLYFAVMALREGGPTTVYGSVERPLQLAQTAAVMEILHGLVGLVRSPVSATLPQIGSRLFLTWGILWSFPETRAHILVSSLVISWSITEIIRYSFFGMKEAFGFAPSWLLWLRYSTFLILYPTGITSEVGLIYVALPYIKCASFIGRNTSFHANVIMRPVEFCSLDKNFEVKLLGWLAFASSSLLVDLMVCRYYLF